MALSLSNCTCEGSDQVYECRISGREATVWRGTAFNCPVTGNGIILFYNSEVIERDCNNGAMIGRTIRAENNTFISQLTVSVSAEMIGMNISCYHYGSTQILIGSQLLTLTSGKYYY